jgi:cell wall-associated NlpC family hydrolase
LTHVFGSRPYVPNGKPLGRHVKASGGGRHVRRDAPAPSMIQLDQGAARYRVAIRAMAVMSLSTGMIGTVALPAYAVDPDEQNAGRQSAGKEPEAAAGPPAAEAQTVVVAADAEPVEATRDQIGATTVEELEAQREREAAEKRAREAAERAREGAASNAPVASDGQRTSEQGSAASAAPGAAAAPSADGGSIVSVARQFLGVPYIFGGASPSGFDCSGLVLYVYAKFGISLPHSSLAQGANGTRVSDPVPGDLVVVDGGNHIGIYTGGGNMIDAPMPGRVVNERPIYTPNHFFVRY